MLSTHYNALVFLIAASIQQTVFAQTSTYNIKVAPLSQTLAQIARQNTVSISANPDLLKGKVAPAVMGNYTTDKAFNLALEGSGLQLMKNEDGSVYSINIKQKPQPRDLGELLKIDVNAQHNALQLPVITVEAENETLVNGQISKKGRVGLLGEKDLIDTPFNISSYTSESIDNFHAVTVADALSKDASVQSTHASGGFLDSFIIRGFPISEGNLGEIAWDGQFGIAPNYRLLTPYIERVELLKGPSAMLYGMSPNGGVGGAINIVPKRALDEKLTRLTLNYSADSNLGTHIDISRRFGNEEKFGARLNISHADGDTAINNQSRRLSTIATAFDYRGEKLNTTFDFVWQKDHFENPVRPYFLAANLNLPTAPSGKYSATQKWGWSEIEDISTAIQNKYQLTDNTSFFFNLGGGKSEVGRLVDHTVSIINEHGDTSSMLRDGIFKVDRVTADAGIHTNFQTGNIDHEVSFQVSKYQDKYSMSLQTGPTINSNIYQPIYIDIPNYSKVTDVPIFSRSKLSGISLSDTLSLLDQRLMFTVGLRQQYIESTDYRNNLNYKENALTPLFALLYKLTDQTSLYANHIQGLSKGDRAPEGSLNEGQTLEPYKSKQYEVGVKYGTDNLFTSLSAFKIQKPSGLLKDNYYSANGEQENTGLELTAHGQINSYLSAFTSLAYLDAELKNTNDDSTQGKNAIGTPEWRANIGAEWNVQSLSGLSLGSNLTYVDRQPINAANTQFLPSWIKLDINSRYLTKIGNKDVTLRANLFNVFNKKYWSGVASYGTIALGSPRTLTLSATIDF